MGVNLYIIVHRTHLLHTNLVTTAIATSHRLTFLIIIIMLGHNSNSMIIMMQRCANKVLIETDSKLILSSLEICIILGTHIIHLMSYLRAINEWMCHILL